MTLDSVLAEVSRIDRVQCDIHFTWIALRRAATVMATKGDWVSARIVGQGYCGAHPESRMGPKQGRSRSLKLLGECARVIAQSLRQWTEKWADFWNQGGIGARSVEGALYRLPGYEAVSVDLNIAVVLQLC